MTIAHLDDTESSADPLDIVEAVLSNERFNYERGEDDDIHFSAKSAWCDVHGFFAWREDLPALMFTLTFDLKAPKPRRGDVCQLMALINENLWLGHFDLWSDEGAVVFRHSIAMGGRAELAVSEVATLLAVAMDVSDRFYPAFNFLLWAGKTPEEAVQAALFETSGEA